MVLVGPFLGDDADGEELKPIVTCALFMLKRAASLEIDPDARPCLDFFSRIDAQCRAGGLDESVGREFVDALTSCLAFTSMDLKGLPGVSIDRVHRQLRQQIGFDADADSIDEVDAEFVEHSL